MACKGNGGEHHFIKNDFLPDSKICTICGKVVQNHTILKIVIAIAVIGAAVIAWLYSQS